MSIHITPGRGKPGNLDDARTDTGGYLNWLIAKVIPEVENRTFLDEAVEKLKKEPFRHLKNYELLHSMNVNRTYLQIEAGK